MHPNSSSVLMAGKLSFLIDNTDYDFYLSDSSLSDLRLGFSFASNLSSNLEVHGDFAWREAGEKTIIDGNQLSVQSQAQNTSLLGVRYLDAWETTWIAEWLHQPQAYSSSQMREFYRLVLSDQIADIQLAQQAKAAGYGLPNSGKDSFYLRASRKDWLDIVYLNAALTLFYNPHDHSSSITPELLYTPFKNQEVRLRASFLQGPDLSEYDEKLSDRKVELRWRWYY